MENILQDKFIYVVFTFSKINKLEVIHDLYFHIRLKYCSKRLAYWYEWLVKNYHRFCL
jgi:hypothetical protein